MLFGGRTRISIDWIERYEKLSYPINIKKRTIYTIYKKYIIVTHTLFNPSPTLSMHRTS